MIHWDNNGMGNCDLECGMDCYVGGQPLGYTQGECSLTATQTDVPLYQGQPSILVGKRAARIEATVSLACLEMTPEVHRLASATGTLVETSHTETQEGDERMHLTGTMKQFFAHDDIDAETIVVKSMDGQTTYTETDDYVISDEGGRLAIARAVDSTIPDNSDVFVIFEFESHDFTPYLFYGAGTKAIEVGPVVFHKFNPDAERKAHHIIIFWRAVAQGNYNFSYNQDSQSWMSLGVELGILSDAKNTQERHDLCPLFMETWQDDFDPEHLPAVPENFEVV